MNWFANLSTRAKLLWSFGLMIGLLAVVTQTAYVNIQDIGVNQKTRLQQDFSFIRNLSEMRAYLNRNYERVQRLIYASESERQRLRDEIQKTAGDFDRHWQDAQQAVQGIAEHENWSRELRGLIDVYLQNRRQIIDLAYAGETAAAEALQTGEQLQLYRSMRQLLEELGALSWADVQKSMAHIDENVRHSSDVFVGIGLFAILLGLVLAMVLNQLIATPLQQLTRVARSIAGGNLSDRIVRSGRHDEVGALEEAFAGMADALRKLAASARSIAAGDLTVSIVPQSEQDGLGQAFASMVDGLRTLTRDMQEGVSVLASSASEIMASSAQVSSGASETSTAVSETTATADEVKQTSAAAADKARLVSSEAQKTADQLQGGLHAVAETVDGMHGIQEKMTFISEAILNLSEQNQAIGEIIAAVNDMAEQSNLLAVNASIEAAKAGEHGRGFAVVAQEVKSMAAQSKQATTQIRTILNDIQKAIGKAVLSTEEGSKVVDQGVKQSQEAGQVMERVMESLAKVTQAAFQIAKASEEQLVGMDQVGMAMRNIKEASMQNLAATRQTESVVSGLHDLGLKLKQLAEKFKI